MNNNASFIETLLYSKVHDTWATKKEYDYLHQLLAVKKVAPKSTITSQEPKLDHTHPYNYATSTGVKGAIKEDQKKLREMLAYLLKKEPQVNFWKNLNEWRNDFSFKQGAAIKRSYNERAHKDPNFDPTDESLFKSTITEEERNDPNWTPWND